MRQSSQCEARLIDDWCEIGVRFSPGIDDHGVAPARRRRIAEPLGDVRALERPEHVDRGGEQRRSIGENVAASRGRPVEASSLA